jgi:chromosome segregation and condensation protein ScpB
MADATQVTKVYGEVIAPYSAQGATNQTRKMYAEVIAAYSAIATDSKLSKLYVEVISPIAIAAPTAAPIIMVCM